MRVAAATAEVVDPTDDASHQEDNTQDSSDNERCFDRSDQSQNAENDQQDALRDRERFEHGSEGRSKKLDTPTILGQPLGRQIR